LVLKRVTSSRLKPLIVERLKKGMTPEEILEELTALRYRKPNGQKLLLKNIKFWIRNPRDQNMPQGYQPKVKRATIKKEYREEIRKQFIISLRNMGFSEEEIKKEIKILID